MCKDKSDRKCYWTNNFGELWTFQWEWSRRSEWDELKWPALQQRPVLPSPPLASTSNKACFLPTSVGHKRTGIRGRELGKVERQEQRGGENTSMHDNEESIQLAAVHGLRWWLPKTGGRSRSLTDSSRRRAVEDRTNRAGSVTILLTVRTGTECKRVQVWRMVIGWMSRNLSRLWPGHISPRNQKKKREKYILLKENDVYWDFLYFVYKIGLKGKIIK